MTSGMGSEKRINEALGRVRLGPSLRRGTPPELCQKDFVSRVDYPAVAIPPGHNRVDGIERTRNYDMYRRLHIALEKGHMKPDW